jgi:hypothetical protein
MEVAIVLKRSSMCLWFLLAICLSVCGADKAAAPPAPVTSGEMEKLKLYSDNDAGYSMRIPDGYSKLTEDETREVFHGISENFGKEAGQRVLRRPPAFFKGPPDLKDTKLKPPSLAIGYSDLDEPIDPTQMAFYKEKLEEQLRKTGDKFGDINISMVMVDGITSLRIEHDVLNPMDNSRARLIKIAVPGSGRRFDIVFNFSPEQSTSVESAVATVLHTFKVNSHAAIDPETKSKWTRILYWTIGGFALGILLSVLLKVLSGVGETEPESSPK